MRASFWLCPPQEMAPSSQSNPVFWFNLFNLELQASLMIYIFGGFWSILIMHTWFNYADYARRMWTHCMNEVGPFQTIPVMASCRGERCFEWVWSMIQPHIMNMVDGGFLEPNWLINVHIHGHKLDCPHFMAFSMQEEDMTFAHSHAEHLKVFRMGLLEGRPNGWEDHRKRTWWIYDTKPGYYH